MDAMERALKPYIWVIGFMGFAGLSGVYGDPAFLLSFGMFGSFSYYWWNKIDGIDERYMIDRYRAASKVFQVSILALFFISLALCYLVPDHETLVRALLATIGLGFAVAANAWAWLTYRYDRAGE